MTVPVPAGNHPVSAIVTSPGRAIIAAQVSLASGRANMGNVTGTLPVANGGTGASMLGSGLSVEDDALNLGPLTDSGSGASVETDGSGIFGVTGEGWSEQDGTPTPDSPQEIRVARGRNLLNPTLFENNKYQNAQGTGWNISDNNDHWIIGMQSVSELTTYCISGATPPYGLIVCYDSSRTAFGQVIASNNVFTTLANTAYICFSIAKSAMSFNGKLQLELGSTPTPYVPYGYIGLDITANGQTTTTPIPLPAKGFAAALPDGTVDVLTLDSAGRWTWENFIANIELDGTENLAIASNAIALLNTNAKIAALKKYLSTDNNGILSNRFVQNQASLADMPYGAIKISDTAYIKVEGVTTVSAAQAWLQANDTNFIAALATSTTEHGYIALPELPNGATVSIPELESIGVEWWVEGTEAIAEHGRDVSKANKEQEDRITELEAAVANMG